MSETDVRTQTPEPKRVSPILARMSGKDDKARERVLANIDALGLNDHLHRAASCSTVLLPSGYHDGRENRPYR